MGWWGHGVMDGDGPQDAVYRIKRNALGKNKAEEYDEKEFTNSLQSEDKEALREAVHQRLYEICVAEVGHARKLWKWGGPADLIGAAYYLAYDHKVKSFPDFMVDVLKEAFVEEEGEASDFNDPRARVAALRRAKAWIFGIK